MATNRQDTLDPALLRPGRLDRKIEFPNPSRRERRLIFQTVTAKMNLGPDVDLEDCMWRYLNEGLTANLRRVATRQTEFRRDCIYLSSSRSSRCVQSILMHTPLTS